MAKLQYIYDDNGTPLYALVPINEFRHLTDGHEKYRDEMPVSQRHNGDIPHEVLAIMFRKDTSLLAAWRIYRGLSQKTAADLLGISQSALSQTEKKHRHVRLKTRKQLAQIYQCTPEQLEEKNTAA